MTIRRAMVLAAGLGLRMRPLSETRPKPLIEVSGRPLIDHALDHLAAVGVEVAVVNVHWLGEQIAAHLADRRRPRIVISREPELLETGGGIVKALPDLGAEPFFVINSDMLWLDGTRPALERLARAWRDADMDALLLLHRTVAAVGYDGVGDYFADPLGKLTRRRPGEVAPHVYAGVQVLHPRLLVGAPAGAFSLNRCFDRAEEAGRLFGLMHDGLWFHVGTPADLATTQRHLDELKLVAVAEPTD
ncbi:MAG TPA: nucleotidyltransferase family protein [Candidatus Sulfotelmatobacter sp.]|nr:nucleotidyltransferase family protein [Candidatus Sulfotelmatobacter sp.]